MGDAATRARALDETDPLRDARKRFVGADDPAVAAYLDGNSLGRPLASLPKDYERFVEEQWGGRLIRGWDEGWLDLPLTLGDRIGAVTLGAAPGQTVVADSTTVNLYKLVRTALDLQRPHGRDGIVIDRGNFPTDRFVVEGIAAETGARVHWIDIDPAGPGGVTLDDAAAAIDDRTALILLSHVAYRSGYVADAAAITALAHDRGALALWDLSHSVGAVPVALDDWGADLATGCSYKYLNGGPGAPAFLYVNHRHHEDARQPIHGWLGDAAPFDMAGAHRPAPGIRRFLSGTPPVLGMLGLRSMLDLIAEVGLAAIRQKSLKLTDFALALHDDLLAPLGATLSSPRDHTHRGSHVTIDHPRFPGMTEELWRRGIIPDFRAPTGLRLGLSPLSTSFAEVATTVEAIRDLLMTPDGTADPA